MHDSLLPRLQQLFAQHRIVFWYDPHGEFRMQYGVLELPEVEKREIANNELGLKVAVHRHPEQKFLLYAEAECPPPRDNWLLDLLLAHGTFRTDPIELLLEQLELERGLRGVVEAHPDFFKQPSRVLALKEQLTPDENERSLRRKMMGVLLEVPDPTLEGLLLRLFASLAEELRTGDAASLPPLPGAAGEALEEVGLAPWLWQEIEATFGYQAEPPTLLDFSLTLLRSSLSFLSDAPLLAPAARTLLNHWKDSSQFRGSFASLAQVLGGPQFLNATELAEQVSDVRALLGVDTFLSFDERLLQEIVHELTSENPPWGQLERWIRQRRETFWQEQVGSCYAACDAAVALLSRLQDFEPRPTNRDEALKQYSESWHEIDRAYRTFWLHHEQAAQRTLFEELANHLEKRYVNAFLLPLNQQWSELIASGPWESGVLPLQSRFFERFVQPVLDRQGKLYVVVSDALRYESVAELRDRVEQEDRYTAKLSALLGLLPSYTQLGMAALLPHQALEVAADGETVWVDGQPSQGLENRRKRLQEALPGRATALQVRDFLLMNKEEGRALTRDHDVIYLYHNQVDAIGDDPKTEHRVFSETEDAFEELLRIFKKVTAFNGNHLLLTADHGYLYQQQALAEDDFTSLPPVDPPLQKIARRFAIGTTLPPAENVWHRTAPELGLVGEVEFYFPRGLQRFRRQGAGMKFVHGGLSLQELVIPVLSIHKHRTSDTGQVEVDLLRQGNSLITTNQIVLAFYQREPVQGKLLARTLRAGFYLADGTLVSERHELVFDLPHTDSQQREARRTFHFTQEAGSNLSLTLRVESKIPGTTQFAPYLEQPFTLRKAFETDF